MTGTTVPKEPPDELVWRICPYLRPGNGCKHCPEWKDLGHHGMGSPGCYLLAREVINIAQTGNEWRHPQ